MSCSMSAHPLEEGAHDTVTIDAQLWAESNHMKPDFDEQVFSDRYESKILKWHLSFGLHNRAAA